MIFMPFGHVWRPPLEPHPHLLAYQIEMGRWAPVQIIRRKIVSAMKSRCWQDHRVSHCEKRGQGCSILTHPCEKLHIDGPGSRQRGSADRRRCGPRLFCRPFGRTADRNPGGPRYPSPCAPWRSDRYPYLWLDTEGQCTNPDALKGHKLVAGGNAPGTVIRNPSDPDRGRIGSHQDATPSASES